MSKVNFQMWLFSTFTRDLFKKNVFDHIERSSRSVSIEDLKTRVERKKFAKCDSIHVNFQMIKNRRTFELKLFCMGNLIQTILFRCNWLPFYNIIYSADCAYIEGIIQDMDQKEEL